MSLSKRDIEKRLEGEIDIRLYREIDSTNSEAKRLLEGGKGGNMLIVAEAQTNGRGRQGKSFYSPPETGVYMSLALTFESEAAALLPVTSAAAVAVCRATEALTDRKPEIKWVNDVYVDGKKVCGILCEAVRAENKTAVIIGIGINISTESFPEYVERGGCLGTGVDRAELIAAVTNELMKIAGKPCSSFIDYYRSRFMLTGKEIVFIKDSKRITALVKGVDSECGLRVVTLDGNALTLTSGEISIAEKE